MKTAVALLVAAFAIQQPSRLETLLERMDAYLAAYEPQLSELVADEVMQQEVRGRRGFRTDNITPIETRLLRRLDSEVAFIALPGNAGWLGFRHVKNVDTKPVELTDASLTVALGDSAYDRARALLNASAEHNLGLPRTTNLPNLPLEFLHPRNRKRLLSRIDNQETIRGVRATRLVMLERITPTLIVNPDTGVDMPSVVRAWIDPRTGQLLRAEVSTFKAFENKDFEHRVRVEFAFNKAFGILVPVEMREDFAVEQPGRGTSVATYANFRRFQTSARIVPQ